MSEDMSEMALEEAKLLLRMKVTDTEDGEGGRPCCCHLTLRLVLEFAMQEAEEAEKAAMEASAIAGRRMCACLRRDRETEKKQSNNGRGGGSSCSHKTAFQVNPLFTRLEAVL